jgi:hypothetical protein
MNAFRIDTKFSSMKALIYLLTPDINFNTSSYSTNIITSIVKYLLYLNFWNGKSPYDSTMFFIFNITIYNNWCFV